MTKNTSPTLSALPAAPRVAGATRPALPDARGPTPRSNVFCTLEPANCQRRPQGSAVSLAG
jgi:hypothetical protein